MHTRFSRKPTCPPPPRYLPPLWQLWRLLPRQTLRQFPCITRLVVLALFTSAPTQLPTPQRSCPQFSRQHREASWERQRTGGSVWPTAINWTQVSIGTPPLLFPVATDSRSGDLDVGGKGCVGCTTVAPNRPYDHTQSSTSKPAAPFAFSNSYQTCDLQDPTVRTYALHAPILPSNVVGRLNHLTQFSLFALIWCCRKRSQPASFRCLLSHV